MWRQNNYSPAQFYGYSSDGGENWTIQSTTSDKACTLVVPSGQLSQVNDGGGMAWDGTNLLVNCWLLLHNGQAYRMGN